MYGRKTKTDKSVWITYIYLNSSILIDFICQGRSKARQKKMYQIAQLLEIPGQITESSLSVYSNNLRSGRTPREHRPLFTTINRAVPGFAAALRRDSMPSGSVSRSQMTTNRNVDK